MRRSLLALALAAAAPAAADDLPADMLAAGAAAVGSAEAAAAAFVAMAPHQWQPIETAPKDREILLGLRDATGFRRAIGGWEVHDEPPFDGGRWTATVWWGTLPTHWMEIPPLPE